MLAILATPWRLGLVAVFAAATSNHEVAGGSCVGGGYGDACASSPPRGNALIQKQAMSERSLVSEDSRDAEDSDPWKQPLWRKYHALGRAKRVRGIIEYFKEWSKGEIGHRSRVHDSVEDLHKRPGASLLAVEGRVTSSYVANVLGNHRELFCQGSFNEKVAGGWVRDSTSLGDNWRLHSSSTDGDGVHHAILLSPEGHVHYVAVRNGRVVASDPPACPHGRGLLHEASMLSLDNVNATTQAPQPVPEEQPDAGEPESIPNHDPLVLDAIHNFEELFNQTCSAAPQIKVLAGKVEVTDPLETFVLAEVNGECVDIKVSHNYEDEVKNPIGLLELSSKPGGLNDTLLPDSGDNVTRYPADGIIDEAEFVDIFVVGYDPTTLCSIGQNGRSCSTARLMQIYKFGDDSTEKANQWEMDLLPKLRIDSYLGTQSSIDLRTDNAACFPGPNHENVVRNQGSCGSCWAFASATALMHNLCASNSSANLKANGDRREVSVQQILSCNSYKRGCNGGNAAITDGVAEAHGLDREVDAPYLCGSGNSLNHFTQQSVNCDKWPWGTTCNSSLTVPEWKYYGVLRVRSENAIKSVMSFGQAVYMRFDVFSSFMASAWHGTIYGAVGGHAVGGPTDTQVGGHAVVGVGFGTLKGVKYWVLQNSWGDNWNENGYCKFVRGKNLGGIEKGGEWFRVETEGGVSPPCLDSTLSGFTSIINNTRVERSCQSAQSVGWCHDARVRGNCPASCGVCTLSPTPPTPPPTPSPTPGPTPAPPPTPAPTPAPTLPPTPAPTPAPLTPSGGPIDSCDFESPPVACSSTGCNEIFCGMWEQSKNDDFEWTRRGTPTPSLNTGPHGGFNGTRFFLYIETSSPRKKSDKAILRAKGVTLENGASLSFSYNMAGSSIFRLAVNITIVGSSVRAFEARGDKGTPWLSKEINLNQYAGQTVDIEFEATRGLGWAGDIAIDAIHLDHGLSGGGGSPATAAPSVAQTTAPTAAPTAAQTTAPTASPTAAQTTAPTAAPTAAQTTAPTAAPSAAQTAAPSAATAGPTCTDSDLLTEIKNELQTIEAKIGSHLSTQA